MKIQKLLAIFFLVFSFIWLIFILKSLFSAFGIGAMEIGGPNSLILFFPPLISLMISYIYLNKYPSMGITSKITINTVFYTIFIYSLIFFVFSIYDGAIKDSKFSLALIFFGFLFVLLALFSTIIGFAFGIIKKREIKLK